VNLRQIRAVICKAVQWVPDKNVEFQAARRTPKRLPAVASLPSRDQSG
jgi:hypothetical protein